MVNTITPALFKKYKTAADFANADTAELEKMIHSSGFFRNKAKSVKAACRMIAEQHGGKVPETMEELLELCGYDEERLERARAAGAFGSPEEVRR